MNDKPAAQSGKTRLFSAWRMIAAVIIGIGGAYFLMPALFVSATNKALGAGFAILLAPFIRVITDRVFGTPGNNAPASFVGQYALGLYSLLFQLGFILLILPMIAAPLIAVICGIFLIALGSFTGLALLQAVFGLSIMHSVSPQEFAEVIPWLAAALVIELAALVTIRWMNSHEDGWFNAIARAFKAGEEKIAALF